MKNPPANAGDIGDEGSIPGLERSTGGGHGNPLQLFVPGESYGQRSLAGYSPRGSKKSDMTEHLIQSTGTIIGHYKTKGILTQFGFNSISS